MKPPTESKDVPIRADLRRTVLERIVRRELAPGARIKETQLAGIGVVPFPTAVRCAVKVPLFFGDVTSWLKLLLPPAAIVNVVDAGL